VGGDKTWTGEEFVILNLNKLALRFSFACPVESRRLSFGALYVLHFEF